MMASRSERPAELVGIAGALDDKVRAVVIQGGE
jgi:hypothetical protein